MERERLEKAKKIEKEMNNVRMRKNELIKKKKKMPKFVHIGNVKRMISKLSQKKQKQSKRKKKEKKRKKSMSDVDRLAMAYEFDSSGDEEELDDSYFDKSNSADVGDKVTIGIKEKTEANITNDNDDNNIREQME